MAHSIVNEKICTRCNTSKPTTEFPNQKKGRGGLTSWCRPCCTLVRRKHRQACPRLSELKLSKAEISGFWDKVDKTPGQGPKGKCWEWRGLRHKNGYGRFCVRGGEFIASRVAYFIQNGTDPGERHACHRCDNPPCCNPACLFPGTDTDNARDKLQKGRQGYTGRKPKLPDADVRDIRTRYPAETQQALADEKGVSRRLVQLIIQGKVRKHLSISAED